jgi:hypothetical protein
VKGSALFLSAFLLAGAQAIEAQGSGGLNMPASITAGDALSIGTTGSGKATLYIVGPAQVLKRDVDRGQAVAFPAGTLHNAGHYLVSLVGGGTAENSTLDVLPEAQPATINLLAKPSRLPVDLHNGISGAVYVFDTYSNLVTAPTSVSFELSTAASPPQTRTVQTREGAAWTEMDSTQKEGAAKFVARVGTLSTARIIEQVPGDPCTLRVSAQQKGPKLELTTDPVRDCRGNAVPDGTIVTFTETYTGGQSVVDVPLKRGIAQVEMPARSGATISVASGVVMGNEIRR